MDYTTTREVVVCGAPNHKNNNNRYKCIVPGQKFSSTHNPKLYIENNQPIINHIAKRGVEEEGERKSYYTHKKAKFA